MITNTENLKLTIAYQEGNHGKRSRVSVISLALSLIFFLGIWSSLLGGWYLPKNFGAFLNQVLIHVTETYPLVHDYFFDSGKTNPLFMACVLAVFFVVWAAVFVSIRHGLWAGTVCMLLLSGSLWIFPGDCPWYLQCGFYFCFCLSMALMLSAGRADMKKLLSFLFFIMVLAAGAGLILQSTGADSPWEKLRQEEKAVTPLTCGDFSSLSEFALSEQTAFSVTMENPQPYYLKGYTGAVYTGAGWKELDSVTKSSYNDLFYTLHENSFFGYSQLSLAAEKAGLTEPQDTAELRVEYAGTGRTCLLLPYETAGEVSLLRKFIGDDTFETTDGGKTKSYILQASENLVKEQYVLKQKLKDGTDDEEIKTYLILENSYRDYVFDNYMQLSDEAETALQKVLGDGKELSCSRVKEKILRLLNRYTYDEGTTYDASEGDFLTVFLQEKSGWSVHYATAAALMFRYYGIPARYVEGYLITPGDAKKMKEGSAYDITEDHAHAWAEYYEEGVGWIPFETAGPYIGVMESGNDIIFSGDGDEKNKKQQKKEEKQEMQVLPETEVLQRALMLAAGILIFLLLLLAGLFLYLKSRFTTRKGTRIRDDRKAVIIMVRYILRIMEKKGLPRKNLPVTERNGDVEKTFGTGLAEEYAAVAKIYEQAVYSGRPITAVQRTQVSKLVQHIRKKVKKKERKD